MQMGHEYKRTYSFPVLLLLSSITFGLAASLHILRGSPLAIFWIIGAVINIIHCKWSFSTPLVTITSRYLNYMPGIRKLVTVRLSDINKVELTRKTIVDIYSKNGMKTRIRLNSMLGAHREEFKKSIMEVTENSQSPSGPQ